MNYLIFVWVIAIACFSVLGSMYARKYNSPNGIIGIYVAVLLISNIVAVKIVDYGFAYATAASIIFPITFLLTDIVNERFGRKETQKMILIAFLSQVAVAFFIWICIQLAPAPFWTDQDAFARLFGFAPRIMIASWITFLVSENLDAYIFEWFKEKTSGRHLWMRNAFSSLPAMAVDTVLFVTIAFYGVLPLWPLIWGVLLIKWISGIVDIPFMYLNRRIMG